MRALAEAVQQRHEPVEALGLKLPHAAVSIINVRFAGYACCSTDVGDSVSRRIKRLQRLVATGLALALCGCIGMCDLYVEVRPLGEAFEIHRIDMNYLYHRSDAPQHERFITAFDDIGVSGEFVIVFDRSARPCSSEEKGPCSWWVGDLGTGEVYGPLAAGAFDLLKQRHPELNKIRVGPIEPVWDSL